MEKITPNPAASRDLVRRLCRLTILVASIGFAIGSFLLSPLYITFVSDVVYADTWWVYILYYLTEGDVLAHAVYAVCYPAAIYAAWHAGLKRSIRIPVSFALITLARFLVNFFMTTVMDSALPSMEDFLTFDLPYISALYLLEMLQYTLVIAIALLVKRRFFRKREYREACAIPERKELEPLAPMLPFDRLFALKNPLQRSAFYMALLVFLLRFAGHQIYQMTLYLQTGRSDGILIMILDMIADLFVGVILYFVALLLMNRFHAKTAEREAA